MSALQVLLPHPVINIGLVPPWACQHNVSRDNIHVVDW